jgi:SecD/SecF fusion protein
MTSNDPVIAALSAANPVPRAVRPSPEERADADRILRRVVTSGPRRRPRRRVAVVVPVLSTFVVLVVIAVSLRTGSVGHGGAAGGDGMELIFQALPTPQTQVISAAAMAREVHIMRARLSSVPGRFRVAVAGGDRIAVTSGGVQSSARGRIVQLLTAPGDLLFYDWEANVLAPNGQTVASQLDAQHPTAIGISQGSGSALPGAGGMSLYSAVVLAAKQRQAAPSLSLTRLGPQYYMFGAPGSRACAIAARDNHTSVIAGGHCLLAGPANETTTTPRRQAIRNLAAQLPSGINGADGQVLVVPQGTVLLQAAGQTASDQRAFNGPRARFYVLRDNVSLFGRDITDPQPATDQGGSPTVQFGFTAAGRRTFQSVTAQIARRGARVSAAGATYDQHFALALDNKLLTVPSIDFKQYPAGITGGGGADISAGFSAQSASQLATQLRGGALPLQLRPVR